MRFAAQIASQQQAGTRSSSSSYPIECSSSSSSSSPSTYPSASSSTLYYSGTGSGSAIGTTYSTNDPFAAPSRRSTLQSPPGSTATATTTTTSTRSASSGAIRYPPRHSLNHPKPYRGRNTPFPIPVGKRTTGGLAAVDEHKGDEVYSQLFGQGNTQPAPLGKTRCYWALLSTDSSPSNPYDLTFLFCDPVLQNHLNTEADLLIGKSFFDFVHPDEREQAQRDLAQIVASETLFGSVTRCRYFRVPAIREHLGCKQALRVPGSELYSDDHNFITLDFVLNMVGESLALCFFHAIINKSVHDNDETNKTDWTNWCGTPRALFDMDQCEKLWTSVATLPKPLPPLLPTASHVFQILSLPADDSAPEIIFSWPPARFFPDDNNLAEHYPSTIIEAYEDGSYFADEFARLAQGVRTSPSARTESGQTARNGEPGTIQDGANTSCTRRFRSKHTLTTEGMLRSVESVLVPYGTIMLACFNTKYQQIMNRSYGGVYSELAVTPNTFSVGSANVVATAPNFVGTGTASSSSVDSLSSVKSGYAGAFAPASYVPACVTHSMQQYPQTRSGNEVVIQPYRHGDSLEESLQGQGSRSQGRWPLKRGSSSPWSIEGGLGGGVGGGGSGGRSDSGNGRIVSSSLTSAAPEVAEADQSRIHRHDLRGDEEDDDGGEGSALASLSTSHGSPQTSKLQKKRHRKSELSDVSTGGSGDESRPIQSGIALSAVVDGSRASSEVNKRCSSCGTANSPEWRKGPSGLKTLCNACGLRFSRSVNRQQKKSEKEKLKKGGVKNGKDQAGAGVGADAHMGMAAEVGEDGQHQFKADTRSGHPSFNEGRKKAKELHYINVTGSDSNLAVDHYQSQQRQDDHHQTTGAATKMAGEGYGAHTARQIDSMGWGPPVRTSGYGNGTGTTTGITNGDRQ